MLINGTKKYTKKETEMNQQGPLSSLSNALEAFATERDWHQFHSPKNLAMALTVEAAEIMEIFQWQTTEQSMELEPKKMQDVEEELADTFIYLIRLADTLAVDHLRAAESKLKQNRDKYPADIVRENSAKYTEYNE
jgi:NTP pyrophosphatase (non-canonical NTP hydrolase)